MSRLSVESANELAAAAKVKQQVVSLMETTGMTTETLAERLGLLPEGAQSLLARQWTLERAWRVAEALGLSPLLVVCRRFW